MTRNPHSPQVAELEGFGILWYLNTSLFSSTMDVLFIESDIFKNLDNCTSLFLSREQAENQQKFLKKSEFVPKRRTSQLVASVTKSLLVKQEEHQLGYL